LHDIIIIYNYVISFRIIRVFF